MFYRFFHTFFIHSLVMALLCPHLSYSFERANSTSLNMNESFERAPGLIIHGGMGLESFGSFLSEVEKNKNDLTPQNREKLDRYKKIQTMASKVEKCLVDNGQALAELNAHQFLKGIIKKDCINHDILQQNGIDLLLHDFVEINKQSTQKPKDFNSEAVANIFYQRQREKLITSHWALELSIGKNQLPSNKDDILKAIYGENLPEKDESLENLIPLIEEQIENVRKDDKRETVRSKTFQDLKSNLRKYGAEKQEARIKKESAFTNLDIIEHFVEANSPFKFNTNKLPGHQSTTTEVFGGHQPKISDIFPNGDLPQECNLLPMNQRLPCLLKIYNEARVENISDGENEFSRPKYVRSNQKQDQEPLKSRIEKLKARTDKIDPDLYEWIVQPFLEKDVIPAHSEAISHTIEAEEVRRAKIDVNPIMRGSALSRRKNEESINGINGLNPLNGAEYLLGLNDTNELSRALESGWFKTDDKSFDEYIGNYFATIKEAALDLEEKKADLLDKNQHDDFIDELLYYHPDLIGEYLAANPDHAAYICQRLTKVVAEKDKDMKAREKRLNYLRIGTVVASVLLVVATLGTALPGAAAAIAGTAGLSVATLNTTLAAGALTLGAVSAGTGFYESTQLRKQADLATQSLVIKGIGDPNEIQSLVNQANGALSAAIFDTALLPLDLAVFRNGLMQLENISELRKVAGNGGEGVTDFLKNLKSNKSAVNTDLYNALKKEGFSDADILNYFKKSGISTDEIEKLARQGLTTERLAEDKAAIEKLRLKIKNGEKLSSSEKILAEITLNGQVDLVDIVYANSKLSMSERITRLEDFLKKKGRGLTETQQEALEKAHRIGEDTTGAGVYKYTEAEIGQKIEMLKSANFSPDEIYYILKSGLAGSAEPTLLSRLMGSFGPKNSLSKSENRLLSKIRDTKKTSTLVKEQAMDELLNSLGVQINGSQEKARINLILSTDNQTSNGLLDTLKNLPDTERQTFVEKINLIGKQSPSTRGADQDALEEIERLVTQNGGDFRKAIDEAAEESVSRAKKMRADEDLRLLEIKLKEVIPNSNLADRFSFAHSPKLDELIQEDVIPFIFPRENFPKGSVIVDKSGIRIDPSKVRGLSNEQILKFQNRLANFNETQLRKGAITPVNYWKELFQEFGIENEPLLINIVKESVGGISLEKLGRSQILGIKETLSQKFNLSPTLVDDLSVTTPTANGRSILTSLEIPAQKIDFKTLEEYDAFFKAKKHLPSMPSKDLQVQELTSKFYSHIGAKESLGNRSSLVPENLDDLISEALDNTQKAKAGWEKVDISDTSIFKSSFEKRVILRNESTGQHMIVNYENGHVHSVEYIVKRDLSAPEKGVAFFSYDGTTKRLSDRFSIPKIKTYDNAHTGGDCLRCHVGSKNGSLFSRPTGANHTQRKSAGQVEGYLPNGFDWDNTLAE